MAEPLICMVMGHGGVGKTTSAALTFILPNKAKKHCVVGSAHRLADALGVEMFDNEITETNWLMIQLRHDAGPVQRGMKSSIRTARIVMLSSSQPIGTIGCSRHVPAVLEYMAASAPIRRYMGNLT